MRVRRVESTGYVLVGFPETESQARRLENALSGYVAKEEVPRSEREIALSASKRIVTNEVAPVPAKELVPSGLDLVALIGIEGEECIRRAQGRLVDPQTNTVYHPEDNPPPEGVKGLQERLVPFEDPEHSVEFLVC